MVGVSLSPSLSPSLSSFDGDACMHVHATPLDSRLESRLDSRLDSRLEETEFRWKLVVVAGSRSKRRRI